MEEEGSQGGSGTAAAKVKKKMTTPKDPHAPKKPLTAYNIFAADQRVTMKKKNPDRSFGDMNREIGSQWGTMTQEQKQPYIDQAEEHRERYMKEVEAYQKSDKYKRYLQTVAALQQRQQQKKDEKEKIKLQTKSSSPSKVPKDSFVAGTEIPIFTNQFLLHNRELEGQVRKLRQVTMDMEEENALLSRHVDNMRTQTNRLETEIQNQTLQNQVLKQHLVFLKETLSDAFGEVTFPGIDSVPSVDTIEDYLKELEAVVGRQSNDEHSDVVSVVRKVARELFERVKARGEEGVRERGEEERGEEGVQEQQMATDNA